MDSLTSSDGADAQTATSTSERLSRFVDWVVAALLVLGGVAFAALGVLLNVSADRGTLARMVAEGTLRSDTLSNAELVDVAYAMFWWGGLGLAVTGVLLVVAGVAFLVLRSRSRGAESAGGLTGDTLDAIVGAVVSVVVAFVPFSPVLGGGVAGYLAREHGGRVGALSGVVATLPVLVVFAFLAVGLATAGFAVVAVLLAFPLVVSAAYMIGLSAIGGYVGQYLYREHVA